MNIHFYYLSTWKVFNSGVASISAVLKNDGDSVSLEYVHPGISADTFRKKHLSRTADSRDNCFLISSVTDSFEGAKTIVPLLRKAFPESPIILGGAHASVAPEEAISIDGLTGICVGEGELSLRAFLKGHKNGNYNRITGFWFKQDGVVSKNPLTPLIEDLDSLPFADYRVFPYQEILASNNFELEYFANRGCPYNCAFCINKTLIDMYNGLGRFCRYRSCGYVIEDLKRILKSYPEAKSIEFYDDTFILNKAWLDEFLPKYREEINLPFSCNARANILTRDIASLLKEAGCYQVNMAIETGNENLRKKILSKNISNQQLIEAFSILREFRILSYSHNMIGIPDEDESMILETIKMNCECKVDKTEVSVFRPYPGTDMYDYCLGNKWLSNRKTFSYTSEDSILDLPTISNGKIKFYSRVFLRMVKKPKTISTYLFCVIAKNDFLYASLLKAKKLFKKLKGDTR